MVIILPARMEGGIGGGVNQNRSLIKLMRFENALEKAEVEK